MVVISSVRPFRRLGHTLLIFLRPDEWPEEAILPPRATVFGTQTTGPPKPYWVFYLEPDKTVEIVIGWFHIPLTLEDTDQWYRAEMKKRGWMLVPKRSYTLDRHTHLLYPGPTVADIRVEIDMRPSPDDDTIAVIRRIAIHPWPSKGEEAQDAGEPPTSRADEQA